MSIVTAMIGFAGRIPRKTFWLTVLVQSLFLFVVFFPLMFWLTDGQWLSDGWGKTPRSAQIEGIAVLVPFLLILYPSLAAATKRLHELGYSAAWCVPLFAPGAVSTLIDVAGLGGTSDQPSLLSHLANWPNYAAAAVFVVLLGCVPGTRGENRFGPDPRAGA